MAVGSGHAMSKVGWHLDLFARRLMRLVNNLEEVKKLLLCDK